MSEIGTNFLCAVSGTDTSRCSLSEGECANTHSNMCKSPCLICLVRWFILQNKPSPVWQWWQTNLAEHRTGCFIYSNMFYSQAWEKKKASVFYFPTAPSLHLCLSGWSTPTACCLCERAETHRNCSALRGRARWQLTLQSSWQWVISLDDKDLQ